MGENKKELAVPEKGNPERQVKNGLEIVSDKSGQRIILDGHEIRNVLSYTIRADSRGTVLTVETLVDQIELRI